MTQETALSILKTGANVFLTGEPGSGKTYVVSCYVDYLRKRGIKPAITASTGIAATHIGGMTVHSWSGIGIRKELSPSDIRHIISNKRISRRIRKTHILIIDEVSMLDGKTLILVDQVCKAVRDSTASFGGMQVVLVGDFFQLPPVVSQSRDDSFAKVLFEDESLQFAFKSPAWISADLSVCYLSEQHRQSEAVFLKLLSAIRSNSISAEHRKTLDCRLTDLNSAKAKNVTKLFPHNKDVDQINSVELEKLLEDSKVFIMEGLGNDLLVQHLKRGCLSPERLMLKLKAVVMFTKNNFELGFVNGTLGTVVDFDKDSGFPIVKTRDGKRIIAEPMEWSIGESGEAIATIRQIPLRLAWAITIHKSQGMSLDAAFMDLSGAFIEGQGYVALSRVRTLEGLFLGSYSDKAFSIHPIVLEKDHVFRQLSSEAESTCANLNKKQLAQIYNNSIVALGGNAQSVKEGETIELKKDKAIFNRDNSKERRWNKSLNLICEGGTIAEASRMRGRTEETIIKHLENLKALGKLPINQIVHLKTNVDNNAIIEIQNAFKQFGIERLKPVYDYFKGRHSYKSIRLARLLMPSIKN